MKNKYIYLGYKRYLYLTSEDLKQWKTGWESV